MELILTESKERLQTLSRELAEQIPMHVRATILGVSGGECIVVADRDVARWQPDGFSNLLADLITSEGKLLVSRA